MRSSPRRGHGAGPGQGARGGTHTAQHIRTGLVEELQGLPAQLGKAGISGELQHGRGEVQLGHHQQHSVGHLGVASVLVSDPKERGWRMGVSSLPTWNQLSGEVCPLFTASPHSYRQVYCVPFPMEEPGVAFVVIPLQA